MQASLSVLPDVSGLVFNHRIISRKQKKEKSGKGIFMVLSTRVHPERAFLEGDLPYFQFADHLVVRENAYSVRHMGVDDKSPTLKVLPVGLAASC